VPACAVHWCRHGCPRTGTVEVKRMSSQVVVAESYSFEAVVRVPDVLPVEPRRERPLPWRQIRLGAAVGAVLGLGATATVAESGSSPGAIAGGIDIATAAAIIGGLWGATFVATDED